MGARSVEVHVGENAAAVNPLKVRARHLVRTERKVTADLLSDAFIATNTSIAEGARSIVCAETGLRESLKANRAFHVENLVRLPKRTALAYLDRLRALVEGSAPRAPLPLRDRALRATVRVSEVGSLVLEAKSPTSPGGSAIVDEERGPILRAVQRAGEELRAIEADVRGER